MNQDFLLPALGLLLLLGVILYFIFRPKKLPEKQPFKKKWRKLLRKNVRFYGKLRRKSKRRFERRIQEFFQHVKITGIETEVDDLDRLLVASSAIIPTFGFPKWKQYPQLTEVLLYKNAFRRGDFATEGEDRSVAGMVGNGFMNGKLLLSKPSLRNGFQQIGPNNTGIHEFAHLLDKADGEMNGVPEYFLENQYIIPWMEMIRKASADIAEGESNIDDYALTNRAEFFAVTSEYFFSKPKRLARDHPRLYLLLERIFQLDMNRDGGVGEYKE